MVTIWVAGQRRHIDRRVFSVTRTEVELGSSTGKRWTMGWNEIHLRVRDAPDAIRRATGLALLDEALELREPGYRFRRARARMDKGPPEVLDALARLVERHEAGEEGIAHRCAGGPADGLRAEDGRGVVIRVRGPDGVQHRYVSHTVRTIWGPLPLFVPMPSPRASAAPTSDPAPARDLGTTDTT